MQQELQTLPPPLADTWAQTHPPVHRSQRLLGIDALRAFAACCVIFIHSAMPYLSTPFPGAIWCVESLQKSSLVTQIFWGIEAFTMPLFFMISGYFSANQLHASGPDQFLKRRVTKLFRPLLLGWCFVMPIMLYTWVFGLIVSRNLPMRKLQSLRFEGDEAYIIWGAGHLWYLSVLILLCMAAWGISKITTPDGNRNSFSFRNLVARALKTLGGLDQAVLCGLGAVVASFLLLSEPRILLGFRNSWYPYWQNTLFYGIAFGLGWASSAKRRSLFGAFTPNWKFSACALLAFAGYQFWLKAYFSGELSSQATWIFCFFFTSFGFFFSAWLLNLALQVRWKKLHRLVQLLADGSLWIYLIHPIFAGLISIMMESTDWTADLKFFTVFAGSLVCSMLTYCVFVQKSRLGRFLNG